MNVVRKPAVAGYFYPSSPQQLQKEVDTLLTFSGPIPNLSNVTGLVCPHAGYAYSGKTAAFAFKLLEGTNFKTAIVISPSHQEYFPGISIYDGDAYSTPLGVIKVNKEIAEKLTRDSNIIFKGVLGHKQEHAIEVQLPFLQTVLKDFQIVPIVMGDQGKIFMDDLAAKLSEVIDDKTILIASSDLSHYHSKSEADRLDSVVEKRINDFDYEGLQIDLEERNCEACGGGPIVAMMKAASMLNKKKSKVLHRSDSGDTTGDNLEVVGYLSAAVYGN